jgi:pimeloyl-ACP methyl ester carboxylesterase
MEGGLRAAPSPQGAAGYPRLCDHLAVERIPHPRGGALAADVDRRSPGRVWAFLHGFGSDRAGQKAAAFRSVAASEGATFVAIDFRGHGESPGSIEELTLSGMLEDVDAMAAVHVPASSSLVLVGSSLGGLAAAWWASRNPSRVRACVLVAPAFRFMPRFFEEIGEERRAAWERTGTLDYRNEWLDVRLRWPLAQDALRYREKELAAAYRTDTLIVHGLRDERVPWRESVDFVDACPHRPIDVALLGDGDHRLAARAADVAGLARDFTRRRR